MGNPGTIVNQRHDRIAQGSVRHGDASGDT